MDDWVICWGLRIICPLGLVAGGVGFDEVVLCLDNYCYLTAMVLYRSTILVFNIDISFRY